MNTSGSKISLLKFDYPLETMNMIKLLGSTGGTVSPAYAEGKESTPLPYRRYYVGWDVVSKIVLSETSIQFF